MKIEEINSRRLFGKFGPRAPEQVPEELRFFAKVALTLCAPAIAFSWTMDSQVLLLCLTAHHAIGVVCGWLLYKLPARLPLSCVPVHVNPTVPAKKLKEAA